MPAQRKRNTHESSLLLGPLVITILLYVTLVQLGYFQLLVSHEWVGGRLWKYWLLTPFVGPFDGLQVFTAVHALFVVLVLLRLWSALRSSMRPRWPAVAILFFCLYPIGQLQYCVHAARTGLAEVEEAPLASDEELIATFGTLRLKLEKMLPIFQEWGSAQQPETELHWLQHYRLLDWSNGCPTRCGGSSFGSWAGISVAAIGCCATRDDVSTSSGTLAVPCRACGTRASTTARRRPALSTTRSMT